MSGRVLLMFVFFFQALYAENGGLHQIFTKPSFFGVVTGTRSPRRPHASHVAHPTVPAAALSLLSLSALVCVGFKTEWSALILTVTLGVSNIWMYPFWCAARPPRAARTSQPRAALLRAAASHLRRPLLLPASQVRPRAAVRLL